MTGKLFKKQGDTKHLYEVVEVQKARDFTYYHVAKHGDVDDEVLVYGKTAFENKFKEKK